MAFKSIGQLALDVLREAEAKRAGAIPAEIVAVPVTHREDKGREPPCAQPANGTGSEQELVSRSSGDQTETGTHVRGSKADKRSNAGDTVILTWDPLVGVADRALMRPALTVARNMRATSPDGLPHPVARIFLVTIDGVRVHAGSVSL